MKHWTKEAGYDISTKAFKETSDFFSLLTSIMNFTRLWDDILLLDKFVTVPRNGVSDLSRLVWDSSPAKLCTTICKDDKEFLPSLRMTHMIFNLHYPNDCPPGNFSLNPFRNRRNDTRRLGRTRRNANTTDQQMNCLQLLQCHHHKILPRPTSGWCQWWQI